MIFADLAAGDQVFLDANTLVYHFGSHPVFGPACNQLIQRIENQELQGFTSTHALSAVAHHLMTLEASALFGWATAPRARFPIRHSESGQVAAAPARALASGVEGLPSRAAAIDKYLRSVDVGY
ncbi:MAG: type II toxin-antitoxin system VapC family toxin [Isosphaeraceae bacterium]